MLEPSDGAGVAGLRGFVGFVARHAGAPTGRVRPGSLALTEVVGFGNCQGIVDAFPVDLLDGRQLRAGRSFRIVGIADCRLRAGEVVDLHGEQRQAGTLQCHCVN